MTNQAFNCRHRVPLDQQCGGCAEDRAALNAPASAQEAPSDMRIAFSRLTDMMWQDPPKAEEKLWEKAWNAALAAPSTPAAPASAQASEPSDELSGAEVPSARKEVDSSGAFTDAEIRMIGYCMDNMEGLSDVDWRQHGFRQATYEKAQSKLQKLFRAALASHAQTVPQASDAANEQTKTLYIKQHGSDKGWLGIEGSYFISGVQAGRASLAQAAPQAAIFVPLDEQNGASVTGLTMAPQAAPADAQQGSAAAPATGALTDERINELAFQHGLVKEGYWDENAIAFGRELLASTQAEPSEVAPQAAQPSDAEIDSFIESWEDGYKTGKE